MSLTAGSRFGPYEIVAPLGAGGMGEVFRARDNRLGRHVAIKVLSSDLAGQDASRERFLREARTISALSHPNICPLFDIGEQDGQLYLVMECLEGQTLACVLASATMPIDQALTIGAQVADGLAHAHAAGIIHRDLKPANIMLLAGGGLKILDFGLARQLAGGGDLTVATLTATGIISGTVAYMSPEQTLGKPIDHRSDIFSLGVVLYETLCGTRPFTGGSLFEVMQSVVTHDPPAADKIRQGLSVETARLVSRVMSKSPEHRPASAAEIAEALRRFAADAARVRDQPAGAAVTTGALTAAVRGWLLHRARAITPLAIAAVGVAAALIPAAREAIVSRVSELARPSRSVTAVEQPVLLPQTAADWTRLGRAYLRRYDQTGNIERAIEAFHKALALDASSAAAHAGLSEAYRQKDSVTPDAQFVRQAIEAGRRAVSLNADLAAAHAALGFAMLRAKQPEDGLRALELALDLDPTNLSALLGMGEYYLGKGQATHAEAVYRRARNAAPSEWVAAQLLGRSLFAQAKYAEALAVWQQADQLTPDNVQVLRNLGAVYQMLDRPEEAAAALQRALAIEPTASVYTNLGTLRFFQGRYSDAASAFEKSVELNATFFLYWANLADAYRWIPGSSDKARQAYARAIALVEERLRTAPDDPDMRTRVAVYAAKFGDVSRAAEELQRWKASAKSTPASHFRALIVHEILGDRGQALAALDAALKAGYAARDIQNEPELAKLRADPRYHRTIGAFEAAR